jgi:flavin reductase (DIM6/NTAB) family NADH-FMN oxidoreductase RutF
MPEREASFTTFVNELDYAMLVVTAAADGERAGCLVGFATQTSIHPGRFLVCVSRKNHTFGVARRARVLVVHLVPESEVDGLARLFGGETGDEVDKFARCRWRPGPDGAPIVEGLPDWFAGTILERLDLGDHMGFLLEPIAGEAGRAPEPLTFHRARRLEPGHPP